jgi:hypothetical protein
VSILAETKEIWHGGTGTPPPNLTPKLDAKGIRQVQKIVGTILFYARAVNMMVLMALSSIMTEQTKAMEKTIARCTQLLDYLSGHMDTKVQFHAFNMILNIHLDAPYLSEAKARSRACGHFYGVDAKRWQAHLFEWSFPCQNHYFTVHCCLCR